uniref:Putative hydroxypyruvate isomerase n=1 Tax=Acrobeloides nanus TaxID=290746 RepID=A0A914D3D9_9BILA
MKVAANFGTMFTNVPLIERYAKAAKLGFKLVEVPFPYSVDAEVLKREADKYNLKHVLINGPPGNFEAGERGLAALASEKDRFLDSLETAVKYAKVLGLTKEPSAFQVFVEHVRIAAERFAKEGIECLIEPINGYTIPGYFLNSLSQAIQVLELVNNPNLKIMFDFFHIQQISGQLTHEITKFVSKIVSQVPKRDEPHKPGEIDHAYVFNLLKQVNPNWIIGAEYVNTSETEDTVAWVKKYGLEF